MRDIIVLVKCGKCGEHLKGCRYAIIIWEQHISNSGPLRMHGMNSRMHLLQRGGKRQDRKYNDPAPSRYWKPRKLSYWLTAGCIQCSQ